MTNIKALKNFDYQTPLTWMKDLGNDGIFSRLFSALFKPSERLRNKISDFMFKARPNNHTLLCAHVRMGRNPNFPTDSEIRQRPKDLKVVWSFLKNQTAKLDHMYQIFLMSDSYQVIEEAKRQEFGSKIITSSGPILHMDKIKNKANVTRSCEGLERVIFDTLILSECDVLMASNSELSKMGAYLRGRNDGLFRLKRYGGKLRVKPCTLDRIRNNK